MILSVFVNDFGMDFAGVFNGFGMEFPSVFERLFNDFLMDFPMFSTFLT